MHKRPLTRSFPGFYRTARAPISLSTAPSSWRIYRTFSTSAAPPALSPNPLSAYFSPFTRAWELALGALVLHERGGAKHTAEAEAILRGEADLPWL